MEQAGKRRFKPCRARAPRGGMGSGYKMPAYRRQAPGPCSRRFMRALRLLWALLNTGGSGPQRLAGWECERPGSYPPPAACCASCSRRQPEPCAAQQQARRKPCAAGPAVLARHAAAGTRGARGRGGRREGRGAAGSTHQRQRLHHQRVKAGHPAGELLLLVEQGRDGHVGGRPARGGTRGAPRRWR